MKMYALQIAVLLIYTNNILSERGEEFLAECPSENIKPSKFNPKRLFSGRWIIAKCLQPFLCSNLLCFVNEFDHIDNFDYSVDSSAFNTSNEKMWTLKGKITYLGQGKFILKSDNEKANSVYIMLGTDYKRYWVTYGCIENASGDKRPAAWIFSRSGKLVSEKATVMEILKKNGLLWDKFVTIYERPCKELQDGFKNRNVRAF